MTRTRFDGDAEYSGFRLPQLHVGKRWFVEFQAKDATGKLKRKRIMIPDNLTPRQKNEVASRHIAIITKQLYEGWSPWIDDASHSGAHGYTLFKTCVEKYLLTLERKDRKKTRSNYASRLNMLMKFIEEKRHIKYAWEFNEAFCAAFLDWLQVDRKNCPRTVNNYRGWLHGFGRFLFIHQYIVRNPVTELPILHEHEKFRKDIAPDMLVCMAEHLKENDLFFYLACLMEYYTFIRPSELAHLTIGDINISEQTIFVDGRHSKNWRSAKVVLNDTITRLMLQLDIFSHPSNFYLFSRNMMPGRRPGNPDMFNRRWKKMREALGWQDCYQFYSLKDTGIRDLANTEGVVIARDQARHSDISTTNKYIQQHEVHESVKHFKGLLE